MFLKEIRLKNFRCFDELSFVPHKGINILAGRNAQGKTSILEAAYLCSTGRSHRTSKDKELIKWNETGMFITSLIKKSSGLSQISVQLNIGERKKIEINGASIARMGELMGRINCVMFSYDDLKFIREGPLERRKFMDIAISQVKPRYFYSLQQYNRILSQRNSLLKAIGKNYSLRKTLHVWNEQLSETAAYIKFERLSFIDRIMKIASVIHKSLSSEKEDFKISYSPSVVIKKPDMKHIRQQFESMLAMKEEEDLRRGITCLGCHRDDLEPSINGVDLRAFGSQGQQKTAVLSLKLAELHFMKDETEEYPVLLLDDCLSEIDQLRQRKFFEHTSQFQTLLTLSDIKGVQSSLLKDSEMFEVENARVRKMNIL